MAQDPGRTAAYRQLLAGEVLLHLTLRLASPAWRCPVKSEFLRHPSREFQHPPKVSAIRAPSTQEETEGARLLSSGFENDSKEIQNVSKSEERRVLTIKFLTGKLYYLRVNYLSLLHFSCLEAADPWISVLGNI